MPRDSASPPPSFYTSQFALLSASSFLFFLSFNMMIPELPAFLAKLGGADYKGLIISLFTLVAGISRPFSGKLADKIGRLPVMVFGVLVCVVCSALYPMLTSIYAFFLLRLVHGFSTGFTPTGTSAYIADIVPDTRRGEAIGMHSLMASVGNALAPVLGSAIANTYGLEAMFYASSALALVSALLFYNLKETLAQKERFRIQLLRINRADILEPKVLPAFTVMILIEVAYGAVLTIVPDQSVDLGMSNKGLYFACMTTSSLLMRFLAGKASDKYGRVIILKISALLIMVAMVATGLAQNATQLLLAGALYGIGLGMGMPTTFAWTIDLADKANTGRAVATTFIALELGIGLGAFLSGWLENIFGNYFAPLLFSGIMSGLAWVYLVTVKPTRVY
jgi:MFS family permease